MCLLLAAPTSTHGVFTSLSLSQYRCLHFLKKSIWVHVGARIFKGQRSGTNHKMLLFVSWRNKYAIIEWPLFDAPKSSHGVFLLLLVYLGTVVYVSVEISLGSLWRRDILRVKGQALFTNCNFLWLCVICNHWVATIWCAIKYPRCLYYFGLSKCCCLQFCRNKFGLLLVQEYFKGQR